MRNKEIRGKCSIIIIIDIAGDRGKSAESYYCVMLPYIQNVVDSIYSLCIGMSLLSPDVVDISHTGEEIRQLTSKALATPENLSHHYLLVPAKLRLVTLAAFILSKCKVSSSFAN